MNDGLLIEDVAEFDVGKLLTTEERWEAYLIIWLRDYPSLPEFVDQTPFFAPRFDKFGRRIPLNSATANNELIRPFPLVVLIRSYVVNKTPFRLDKIWYDGRFAGSEGGGFVYGASIEDNPEKNISWFNSELKNLDMVLTRSSYLQELVRRYYLPKFDTYYTDYLNVGSLNFNTSMSTGRMNDQRRLLALRWILRYEGFDAVADLLDELMPMIEKYLRPLPPIPKNELDWRQDWLESAKKYAAWYRHNIVQAEIRVGVDELISICNSFTAQDLMEMKYNTQQRERYIA